MSILSNEIALPKYSALSDSEIQTDINLSNIEVNKTSMTRQEILEQIDPAELEGLSSAAAIKVFGILSDNVDPFGIAQEVFKNAFGAGSQTIINLAASRKHKISRSEQLRLGYTEISAITFARTGAY